MCSYKVVKCLKVESLHGRHCISEEHEKIKTQQPPRQHTVRSEPWWKHHQDIRAHSYFKYRAGLLWTDRSSSMRPREAPGLWTLVSPQAAQIQYGKAEEDLSTWTQRNSFICIIFRIHLQALSNLQMLLLRLFSVHFYFFLFMTLTHCWFVCMVNI